MVGGHGERCVSPEVMNIWERFGRHPFSGDGFWKLEAVHVLVEGLVVFAHLPCPLLGLASARDGRLTQALNLLLRLRL
eukprot:4938681-Pyramimonas_sp.AAC.1